MTTRCPARSIRPAALALLALAVAAPRAHAQLVHRGADGFTKVTQTLDFLDTWGRGGTVATGAARDVVTRIETVTGSSRRAEVQLLLLGPWGAHLYSFEEESDVTQMPLRSAHVATWRAMDLDGDGEKELVFINRTATGRYRVDEQGQLTSDPGPYFEDCVVAVRWLERKDGALLQHDLDGNPEAPEFKAMLAHELGGPVNAALQLLAADWHFKQQQFEKAKYRYQIVREWAEKSLTGREVLALSPDMPLPSVAPDEAAIAWIQASRRIGSLPGWYQRH